MLNGMPWLPPATSWPINSTGWRRASTPYAERRDEDAQSRQVATDSRQRDDYETHPGPTNYTRYMNARDREGTTSDRADAALDRIRAADRRQVSAHARRIAAVNRSEAADARATLAARDADESASASGSRISNWPAILLRSRSCCGRDQGPSSSRTRVSTPSIQTNSGTSTSGLCFRSGTGALSEPFSLSTELTHGRNTRCDQGRENLGFVGRLGLEPRTDGL